MANDPNQDGYASYTDDQLAGLPGAPKRTQGGYQYSWRSNPYQDVLSDKDVTEQQGLTAFRQQHGNGAVADDDAGALAQMNGQAPLVGASQPSAVQGWLGQGQAAGSGQQNDLLAQMFERQKQQEIDGQQRGDNLYNMLMSRAGQDTSNIANDPNIRQQADAYNADATRASRNYMANLAESAGPYANLRGEQRLASEHLGQQTGAFRAQLIGRELEAKRAEIQNALSQMGQHLSIDQQNALQKQLGILNNSIAQQGIGNDTLRTLLQNQQFNQNLNSQNDQFTARLGFDAADRGSYWDALRRGQLNG